MSQLLRESDIILHVLTENTFSVKKIIGIDNSKAFIRKDQSKLLGNDDLRKQVTPPKSLGQCGSLAFDTEGSIFTSVSTNKKTDNDHKIIASVFAKRIAQNAKPKKCYVCECEGHNSGAAYLTCTSCERQGSLPHESVNLFFFQKHLISISLYFLTG